MNDIHLQPSRLIALMLVLLLVIALLPTQAFAAQAVKTVTVTDLDRPVIGGHPDVSATVTAEGLDRYWIYWFEAPGGTIMDPSKTFEEGKAYYAALQISLDRESSFPADAEGNYLGTVTMRDFDKSYPAFVESGHLLFYTIDFAKTAFVDVPMERYYAYPVLLASKNGITSGTDATHFSPDMFCTRAQAVTFLWRAAGMPEPKTTGNPFVDVKASSYSYKAILWAAKKGITTGTDATHFSPDKICTRAQIVTLLWRTFKKPTPKSTANPFSDVSSSDFCYKAILWASENGITQGTGSKTFQPAKSCTRAQIVTFLARTGVLQ